MCLTEPECHTQAPARSGGKDGGTGLVTAAAGPAPGIAVLLFVCLALPQAPGAALGKPWVCAHIHGTHVCISENAACLSLHTSVFIQVRA